MLLTEEEYAARERPIQQPHRLCVLLRELRTAAGLSLAQAEERFGIKSVVLGAYERGDRVPPLSKLDAVFACYGYRLDAVPAGVTFVRVPSDMVADLRAIADQLESPADALLGMHESAA